MRKTIFLFLLFPLIAFAESVETFLAQSVGSVSDVTYVNFRYATTPSNIASKCYLNDSQNPENITNGYIMDAVFCKTFENTIKAMTQGILGRRCGTFNTDRVEKKIDETIAGIIKDNPKLLDNTSSSGGLAFAIGMGVDLILEEEMENCSVEKK